MFFFFLLQVSEWRLRRNVAAAGFLLGAMMLSTHFPYRAYSRGLGNPTVPFRSSCRCE